MAAKTDHAPTKVTFDGGHFYRHVLKDGTGFDRPLVETVCVVSLNSQGKDCVIGCLSDDQLLELGILVGEQIEVKIGSPKSVAMVTVEKCLMTMKTDEQSVFSFDVSDFEKYVNGEDNEHSLPPCVEIVIVLHSMSEIRPSCNLTAVEKFNLALSHKERGKELFPHNPELAFYEFSTAVKYTITIPTYSKLVASLSGVSQEEREGYDNLKCICYLNLAACQAKFDNHSGVIDNCTQALSLQWNNVKGLYRRGKAYLASGRLEEARIDLLRLSKLSPKNQEVKSLLSEMMKRSLQL